MNQNITDPGVLRVQFCAYVKTLFKTLPHPTNKRFYPDNKAIRNHTYMSKNENLKDEQAKVTDLVKISFFAQSVKSYIYLYMDLFAMQKV